MTHKTFAPPHKYDRLGPAAKQMARVPRYGRLIGLLPADRFSRLTSQASALWQLYSFVAVDRLEDTGLIDDGLKATLAKNLGWHKRTVVPSTHEFRQAQTALAIDILGAIAFQMFVEGSRTWTPHPLSRLKGNLKAFKDAVRMRLVAAGAYRDSVGKQIDEVYFTEDWNHLMAMDSHGLKNFIFSADGRDGVLKWTDITTSAFFAAYWACQWCGQGELQYIRTWLVDPLFERNEAFREFWEFVLEMPVEEFETNRHEAVLAVLFDGTALDNLGRPFRSTEFIYRSWERMAGTEAQKAFLEKFEQLYKADHPLAKSIRDSKKKGGGMIELAQPGSELRKDTGEFQMGSKLDHDNPPRRETVEPFALHQFCVTNVEYELFDPRHVDHRWDKGKQHPDVTTKKPKADDRCPVVMVSWYDAWCFAAWCGCRLPTEIEWEYACRAGYTTEYTFEKGEDELSSRADKCNFDGDLPYPRDKNDGKAVYRNKTLPVKWHEFKPNPWGFWQMHGNVWEWCASWYDAKASDRVLRGGCWYRFGVHCRSAYRYRNVPDYRYYGIGFRLCRSS